MNNEHTAKELAKLFTKIIIECLDEVIEQRCYLGILEILKNIEKKYEKTN
jgi:hypothetical protein